MENCETLGYDEGNLAPFVLPQTKKKTSNQMMTGTGAAFEDND